jgi:hypothetical protein
VKRTVYEGIKGAHVGPNGVVRERHWRLMGTYEAATEDAIIELAATSEPHGKAGTEPVPGDLMGRKRALCFKTAAERQTALGSTFRLRDPDKDPEAAWEE